MKVLAPKILFKSLLVISILFTSFEVYPQSWVEYNIATGIQSTISYSYISTGNSGNTIGNEGALLKNYSSDTGRTFLPNDLVNDPNGFPWRMVVKIGGVTGILIDPYHLLTAGHIIEFSPYFAYTVISPAYGTGDSPFGSARPEKLYRLSNYASGTATDIAIIKLDRPVGALTGWSGYGYNNTNSFFQSNIFFNPNYPSAGIFNGELLYNWKGTFDYVLTDFIYSYRQGIAGMSGSPAFTKVNGDNVTMGTLITSGIKFNRITSQKYDGINKILDLNTPSVLDLIPMYVSASPKILKSGNQLDSLSFVILNYSNSTGSNVNITADVYVSQDSIISPLDSLLSTYTFTENFSGKSSILKKITQNLPSIGKPPGTYWIGVIIAGDNNTGNNATCGYEAAKLVINNTGNMRISGTVNSTQSNNGISGVTLSGFPATVKTDYKGQYETEVPTGWSGSVTLQKEGYSFSPSGRTYSTVSQNISDDYTTSKNTFTISGTVKSPVLQNGIEGMKIAGLAGEPVTNSSGSYSSSVYQGWSGYVNVTKSGWYIQNSSFIYNNINSNKTEQITAGFLVRGYVYRSTGSPIKNVSFNGFPGGTIFSDSNGIYSKLLDSGWSGTVTPSYTGMNFNPDYRDYNNLSTSYYYHNYDEVPVMTVNLKIFLSGPYSQGKDSMITSLKRSSKMLRTPNLNYSSKNSVFTYLSKSYDTVSQSYWEQNNNIVDWVSIQILDSKDFSSLDTTIGLLRRDGRILSLQGDTLLRLNQNLTEGSYYIVVRHRNHIAVMSANPVYLNSGSQLYDFTTGTAQYYGNDAKLLKTGLYGMYAGDANFDGIVNNADLIIHHNESDNGVSGYVISDFNLDGYSESRDFNLIAPNKRNSVSTKIPVITMLSMK